MTVKHHFTADLHLDHRNIAKYSGRLWCMTNDERSEYDRLKTAGDERMKSLRLSDESLSRMNKFAIDKVNSVVGERDVLWILGDFYLKHDLQALLNFRHSIKCLTINYVWGNHDKWWRERCPPYLFNEYHDCCHTSVNSQRIWLSHYAHVVWPKSHRGCWHLWGHSHGSLNPWMRIHMPEAKSMDVGIDTHPEFRPYSFEEIKLVMDSRKGMFPDHHEYSADDGSDD